MIRRIITVPEDFLKFKSVDWEIDWREQSSGISLEGTHNVNLNNLPRWIGSPSLEIVTDEIPKWRAMLTSARGMTGLFRMTMVDYFGMISGRTFLVSFSDGSSFSDSSRFIESPYALSVGDQLAGSSQLVLDTSSMTGDVIQGQILSHNDFPFMVTSIEESGNNKILTVEMPLRKAVPNNSLIRLYGRGIFQLVDPRSGNPVYGISKISGTDIKLKEWLR